MKQIHTSSDNNNLIASIPQKHHGSIHSSSGNVNVGNACSLCLVINENGDLTPNKIVKVRVIVNEKRKI